MELRFVDWAFMTAIGFATAIMTLGSAPQSPSSRRWLTC
jgi:hypothetical protein